MLLAYTLRSEEIAYFNYYTDAPRDVFCPKCRGVEDTEYAPHVLRTRFPIGWLPGDLMCTRDGHDVVSQKFKDFCAREKIQGVDFVRVNKTPPAYDFRPHNIVEYDVRRGRPQFHGLCTACGYYKSIVPPERLSFKDTERPFQSGIWRSDLEFGSGLEKRPIIVVGVRTKELMDAERFKGIVLDRVDS